MAGTLPLGGGVGGLGTGTCIGAHVALEYLGKWRLVLSCFARSCRISARRWANHSDDGPFGPLDV